MANSHYPLTFNRDLFIISVKTFDRSICASRECAEDDAEKIYRAIVPLDFKCPKSNKLVGHVTANGKNDSRV